MDRREMLKGAAIPVFSAGVGWTAVFVPDPKPYDPVAVLEAMRERGFEVSLTTSPLWPGIVHAHFLACRAFLESSQTLPFPDFCSAVLWLHKQAAAVDAEFAQAWPVPE